MNTVSNPGNIIRNCYLRTTKIITEDWKFFSGTAVTLLAPAVLFCSGNGQFTLLYLLAVSEGLGALLGFVWYKRSPNCRVSCVPVTGANTQNGAKGVEAKKAA